MTRGLKHIVEPSPELQAMVGRFLRWHDAVVADLSAREGGRVVKSMGDGHMLVFPPASRAMRSAGD